MTEVRFDPEEWEGLHEIRAPRTLAFRRGMELARDACLVQSGLGELWLDAGSGRGQLARALVARGLRVVRLDLDPGMLESSDLRRAARDRDGADISISAVCAEVARIPCRSEHFAGVAAVSLLGCLDDPSEFFAEVARVLVPGGLFVFTHTNRASLLLRASHLVARGDRSGEPIAGAIRLHSKRSIDGGLQSIGFEILGRRVYHFVWDCGPWSFPSPALAQRAEGLGRDGRLAWLGRNRLVVARKRELAFT